MSFPGPSRPSRIKPAVPFVSAAHRPAAPDGRFRVVIVSTGSVASVRVPEIVAGLVRDPAVDVQVVATKASLHFYDQARVDRLVREACGVGAADGTGAGDGGGNGEVGARVWRDEDEWSDWKELGDPILHIELRRWADLVVVAPCSADMLARLAAGLCDTLALSLLRALPQSTPVILCPAMNTHMYAHPFTRKHLASLQDELGYMVSGPQGVGRLACGDEGPGKMTDWRDIVTTVLDFAAMYRQRLAAGDLPDPATDAARDAPLSNSAVGPAGAGALGLDTAAPARAQAGVSGASGASGASDASGASTSTPAGAAPGPADDANVVKTPNAEPIDLPATGNVGREHWRLLTGVYGERGSMWEKRWWLG